MSKVTVFAFDIDGTIADCTHRLHYIMGKKRDYEAFHKACVNDKPIKPMVELCKELLSTDSIVLFVSARPESSREETLNWLDKHIRYFHPFISLRELNDGINKPLIYLRADGDHRCDSLIKPELMSRVIEDYGVSKDEIVIFEDRKRVVEAYRNEGYFVLDVTGKDY